MFKDVKYVNFNARSTYSAPWGVSRVENHVASALKKGHSAVCISDINSYASFYDLLKIKRGDYHKGLKPTIKELGINSVNTVFAASVSVFDDVNYSNISKDEMSRLSHSKDRRFNFKANQALIFPEGLAEFLHRSNNANRYKSDNLILIPFNEKGHSNLCRIVTETSLPENKSGDVKRIPLSRVLKLSEGLHVLVGVDRSAVKRLIEDSEPDYAKKYLDTLKSSFGGRLILEIQCQKNDLVFDQDIERYITRQGEDFQLKTNNFLISYAKENQLEDSLVIGQNSCLPEKEFKIVQDTLIKNSKTGASSPPEPLHIMSVEELWVKLSSMYPEYKKEDFIKWCENSYKIAVGCFDVNPDTDFKLAKAPLGAHFVNNPTVFKDSYFDLMRDKGVISEPGDDYYVKIKSLMSLSEKGDLSLLADDLSSWGEIDLNQYIDREKTEEVRAKLSKVDQDYEMLRKKMSSESLQGAIVFNESELSPYIKTTIKSALYKGKISASDDQRVRDLVNELKVISANGVIELSNYFLGFEMATDLGSSIGKTTGLGRGSGVGSILNYALDITGVPPWEWDLLFERFLVEERIGLLYPAFKGHDPRKDIKDDLSLMSDYSKFEEMVLQGANNLGDVNNDHLQEELYFIRCNPYLSRYFLNLVEQGFKSDSNDQNSSVAYSLGLAPKPTDRVKRSSKSLPDIDFDSNFKDEICRFFQRLYGKEYTCYIGSYSSLQVKSTCKELFRGVISPEMSIKANKEFDKNSPLKDEDGEICENAIEYFERVSEESQLLRSIFATNKVLRDSVQYCLGSYIHMGIHAGGFIVSPVNITYHCPLNWDEKKSAFVSQLAKDEVEGIGLIKNDYLGLSNLTIIEDACKLIREKNPDSDISIRSIIKTNCPHSLKQFTRDTLGIFQFAGETVTQGVTRLKDMKLHYIPLLTSVYRPGPMGAGFHNKAIDLINEVQEESYFHDSLKDILGPTKGLITYQEQVMAITKKIGGFNGFEADDVRRAMGKKKLDVIAEFEERFVKSAVENWKYTAADAKELWGMLCNFAEYGFNKSHAVAYGLTSYACMYLNYHHTLEFRAACLEEASSSASKKDLYKRYQLAWGEVVTNPDVNRSGEIYSVEEDKIIMPLSTIKSVSSAGIKVAKVAKKSKFVSVDDFLLRTKANKALTSTVFKNLVIAGAMDSLGPDVSKVKSDINSGIFDPHSIQTMVDLCGLNVDEQVIKKINLGIRLSSTDKEALISSISKINFIPTLAFRRNLLSRSPDLLSIDFPKKHGDVSDKSYEELRSIVVRKKAKDEERDKNEEKLASMDLKKEEYKILDIQIFDIKSSYEDKVSLVGDVFWADEIFNIERKCKDFINSFESKLFECIKENRSIINILVSFFNDFQKVAPDYKIGQYLSKRLASLAHVMTPERMVDLLVFEDMVGHSFLWKKEVMVDIPKESELNSSKFQSLFYRMKNEDKRIKTNLSHIAIASLLSLVIKDRSVVLPWITTSKSKVLNDILAKLKSVSKEEGQDLKELVLLMTKNLKESSMNLSRPGEGDEIPPLDLGPRELSAFSEKTNICGSVFRLPKKMKEGVREIRDKKTGEPKIMFKFHLSNNGGQVLALSFNTAETKYNSLKKTQSEESFVITRTAIDKRIHDDIKDYDVLVCSGNVGYSMDFDTGVQIVVDEVSRV